MNRHDIEELSEEMEENKTQFSRPKPQRSSTGRHSRKRRKTTLGIRGRSNLRSVSTSEKRTRTSNR